MSPTGTTVTDPAQSIKLIHRSDDDAAWGHVAMAFVKKDAADPGHFYLAVRYQGDCGLKSTWWRIKFDPLNAWGLTTLNPSLNTYEVQRWDSNVPGYVVDDGIPPSMDGDVWQCNAQDPKSTAANGYTGPADPMDFVVLKKADGSFDSVLYIYQAEAQFGRQPTPIYYVKGTLPGTATSNFQWSAMHALDTSIFWDRTSFPSFDGTYSACGAGGGFYMSANQSAGALYGFAATWRQDLYQPVYGGCNHSCSFQPQGLLPFLFKQQKLGVDKVTPVSGPRSGGSQITVSGEGFLIGASVLLGGVATSSTNVLNGVSISATTPAHAAGPVAIKVSTSAGETDSRANVFVYDFIDVAASHPFHSDVVKVARAAITAGCGSENFCPESPVTRAQMSVFLLKAKSGFLYNPPPATGLFFGDVPTGAFAAAWIEELYREGITAGCSGTATCHSPNPAQTNYCPGSTISREQMAVYLVRAAQGPAYEPVANCIGVFGDVPCTSPYAKWVEDAYSRGYMSACGSGSFCPGSAVLRKQMAQHLAATFALP